MSAGGQCGIRAFKKDIILPGLGGGGGGGRVTVQGHSVIERQIQDLNRPRHSLETWEWTRALHSPTAGIRLKVLSPVVAATMF